MRTFFVLIPFPPKSSTFDDQMDQAAKGGREGGVGGRRGNITS